MIFYHFYHFQCLQIRGEHKFSLLEEVGYFNKNPALKCDYNNLRTKFNVSAAQTPDCVWFSPTGAVGIPEVWLLRVGWDVPRGSSSSREFCRAEPIPGVGELIPIPLRREWAGGGGLQGLHRLGLFPNTSHRHSWSCPFPVLIPELWAALETPIPEISPHTFPSEGTLQQIPTRAP